jgi:receptor protein-tyrosine kinase
MDLIERAAKKAQEKQKEEKKDKPDEPIKDQKELSSVSLVERAAQKTGPTPFDKAKSDGGIGTPGQRRADPSSLNPSVEAEAPTKAFKGIGAPGAKAQLRSPVKSKDLSKTDDGERSSLAIGDTQGPASTSRALVKKKSKRPEEIDLAALREAGYITPDMPPNLMSEEFRIIKRSLLLSAFAKGDKKTKNGNVLLVTSSNPSEGKTFCTINLALSIATEQNVTVLLVDADFSKPEILNRLGISGGRGLMDVVADDSLDLSDCLVRTNVDNLVLLPAGRQHNLTTELLASERMESIVTELSTRYPDRIIIFDSPPVLASSAASVLALYMGQIVFVIEAEHTTESQIKESLGMISSCESINLLLNKTRYNGSNKKFATYYGYGGR